LGNSVTKRSWFDESLDDSAMLEIKKNDIMYFVNFTNIPNNFVPRKYSKYLHTTLLYNY